MVAAEVEVERRVRAGGDAEALAAHPRVTRRMPPVVERAVARLQAEQLGLGHVLLADEDRVRQPPPAWLALALHQVGKTRAAMPLDDAAARFRLVDLALDDGPVGARAGPGKGGIAVARGAGVIADRAAHGPVLLLLTKDVGGSRARRAQKQI